jgi:signal transduction histidine kinase
MKERAKSIGGQLEIESGPGQGMEIELTVPGGIVHAEAKRRP